MVQTNAKVTGIYQPYHLYPTLEMGLLGVQPRTVVEYEHNWDQSEVYWDQSEVYWDQTI